MYLGSINHKDFDDKPLLRQALPIGETKLTCRQVELEEKIPFPSLVLKPNVDCAKA